MARKRRRSRLIMTIVLVLVLGGGLAGAFWPHPTAVDMGQVARAPMMVTIDEEGRTRVHDAYIVSTPIAGRLLRVQVEPGDTVNGGQTVVARMRPAVPPASGPNSAEARAAVSAVVPLVAPADGRILRIIQQDETTLPAGAPVVEIGNIERDLEVVVNLISSDAVKVAVGQDALVEDWGGDNVLRGQVVRVDPFGTTKLSALGVEEQRVGVVIALTSPPRDRENLGHGYRVAARIIAWSDDAALTVPASALFRDGDGWAVFRVQDGVARQTPVKIGQNNGVLAEVLDGLADGDSVVLYPSAGLEDGMDVTQRVIG